MATTAAAAGPEEAAAASVQPLLEAVRRGMALGTTPAAAVAAAAAGVSLGAFALLLPFPFADLLPDATGDCEATAGTRGSNEMI